MRSETKKENKMTKEETYLKTLVLAIQTIDARGDKKEMSKLRRVLDCVLNFKKDFDAALSIAENESENNETINQLNDLGFKKEVISEGITCFTLDSKSFR
jgi:hypothetical protein